MKNLIRAAIWMVLVLSLSLTATATKPTEPKTIEKDTLIKRFKEYIDTIPDLIEQNNSQTVIKNFLELNNIIEDSIVISKDPELSKDSIIRIYRQEMLSTLNGKLLQVLEKQEEATESTTLQDFWKRWNRWVWLFSALLLLSVVVLWMKAKRKREKEYQAAIANADASDKEDAGFVVRRTTTSIMHRQSLDNVYGNDNYMAIDCADFCTDSAVTKMYVKNTCIIDIYNMYAEDLRNPDNPKEDGCMVLGRWLYNERNDEYAVSLEEVVLPGNDAIFSEYELDFGGRIKVKVMDRLKKLRRETELQYDLTCWVHSHPGLGVFFSNNDNNVHLIHKHPSHPKFLTAIVIDILTPNQELGVFTFKHDGSINSKNDLKTLYSLVEWYKWAVNSKRNSFKSEDHYNTLAKAQSHSIQCHNIELTNGAIVDMDKITTLQEQNQIHFVHGFAISDTKRTSYVAVKIDKADTISDFDLIGCFVVVSNRSLPSIMKAVNTHLNRIKFVLVYSSADGMLTTIPVIDSDLCTDETFYGEQQLEELNIWTRRKR